LKMNTGAVIGIVVGSIVLVLILIFILGNMRESNSETKIIETDRGGRGVRHSVYIGTIRMLTSCSGQEEMDRDLPRQDR